MGPDTVGYCLNLGFSFSFAMYDHYQASLRHNDCRLCSVSSLKCAAINGEELFTIFVMHRSRLTYPWNWAPHIETQFPEDPDLAPFFPRHNWAQRKFYTEHIPEFSGCVNLSQCVCTSSLWSNGMCKIHAAVSLLWFTGLRNDHDASCVGHST